MTEAIVAAQQRLEVLLSQSEELEGLIGAAMRELAGLVAAEAGLVPDRTILVDPYQPGARFRFSHVEPTAAGGFTPWGRWIEEGVGSRQHPPRPLPSWEFAVIQDE